MILWFYGRDKAYPAEDGSYLTFLSISPPRVTSIETWQSYIVWWRTISFQVGAREARKQTPVVTSIKGHLVCRKVPCSRSFSVWEGSTTNVRSEAWTYHLIIFCEKSQKKQGLFWEWGYQHHHHKFHPQYSAMGGGLTIGQGIAEPWVQSNHY